MASSFNALRSDKVEVFFTDEEKLTALAQAHQELLDDEPSGVLRLIETLVAANGLASIIEAHRVIKDPQAPEIMQLELDATQEQTLRLARSFSKKSSRETGLGKAALIG